MASLKAEGAHEQIGIAHGIRLLQRNQPVFHHEFGISEARLQILKLSEQQGLRSGKSAQRLQADAIDGAGVAEVDPHPVRGG